MRAVRSFVSAMCVTSVLASGGVCEAQAGGSTPPSACGDDRWIGVKTTAECLPVKGKLGEWEASRLFGSVAGALGTYCVFTWKGTAAPDTAALQKSTDLSAVDRDCAVVAPLGDAADAALEIMPELEAAFLKQVEAPTASVAPGATKVRVAVVDSWPSATEPGNSTHGLGMAGIIERLACAALGEPAPCNVTTVPYLALDLLAIGERRPNKGGYFGFQGRMARAVYDAVEDWKANAPSANLIVNLSIGWDRRYNSGSGNGLSVPVRAVREALRHASCAGAMIFASAGNGTGGPTPDESPTYPAAWEATELAPTAATCVVDPGGAPLLHAVAGVDGLDARLPNGRRDARARLAAPAFLAPASKSVGATPERDTFTGSSVASAVASAIAAAVWSRRGPYISFRRESIVNALAQSGEPLPEPASFCPGSGNGVGCGNITRLSLCRALGVQSGSCPAIAAGAGTNAVLGAADQSAFESHAVRLRNASGYTLPLAVGQCSTSVHVDAATGQFTGASACPTEEYDDEVVGVALWPQPGTNPCPACMLLLDPLQMYLDMAISERLDGPISPMTLTLSDDSGPLERYDLASLLGTVKPGNVYRVTLPPTMLSYRGDFTYATIEWFDARSQTQTASALSVSKL